MTILSIRLFPKAITLTALIFTICCTIFESSSSSFSKIEQAAAKLLTMREHFEQGALLTAHGRSQFREVKQFLENRLIDCATFEQALNHFIQTMRSCLNKPDQWIGQVKRLYQILDPTTENFLTYAQKLHLQENDSFICKGDLHGDIHSLIAFIRQLNELGYTSKDNEFQIIDPHFYLIFLGDYVDRGLWGVEVIYLLLLLKIHNPHQVFLVRGNHEDPEVALNYGFKYEFLQKFADTEGKQLKAVYEKITTFYNYLPPVIYVGSTAHDVTDVVQCCHGGLEMGFNPRELLGNPKAAYETLHQITRRTACEQDEFSNCTIYNEYESLCPLRTVCRDFIPQSPTTPFSIGFMWHDFIVPVDGISREIQGRGLVLDKAATEATLSAASSKKVRLCAIIRAHQHYAHNDDPMMKLLLASKGCAVLWQQEEQLRLLPGTVITLLLSPDTMVGIPNLAGNNFSGFVYDTSLLVTIGAGLDCWKLLIINNEIYAKKAALVKSAVEQDIPMKEEAVRAAAIVKETIAEAVIEL